MKSKKKVFLTVLCAAALVVASVLGTMAFLTSTDTAENTFTVGNVAITLDESPVDTAGNVVSGDRVDKNNYKLIPGHKYTKDPIIHVAQGSENSWVFVKVVNNLEGAEADSVDNGYKNIDAQIKANGWEQLKDENGNDVAGVYYKSNVNALDGAKDLKVFQEFKAKDDLTTNDITAYNDQKIIVTGYAIQADGFTTAKAAWDEVNQ